MPDQEPLRPPASAPPGLEPPASTPPASTPPASTPASTPPASAPPGLVPPALDDRHVDGNALAGPMSRIFALDVTVANCRCGHCGATAALGAAHVYTHCPGNIVRCTTCGEVLLRLTELPGRIVLDLGGGTALSFAT